MRALRQRLVCSQKICLVKTCTLRYVDECKNKLTSQVSIQARRMPTRNHCQLDAPIFAFLAIKCCLRGSARRVHALEVARLRGPKQ